MGVAWAWRGRGVADLRLDAALHVIRFERVREEVRAESRLVDGLEWRELVRRLAEHLHRLVVKKGDVARARRVGARRLEDPLRTRKHRATTRSGSARPYDGAPRQQRERACVLGLAHPADAHHRLVALFAVRLQVLLIRCLQLLLAIRAARTTALVSRRQTRTRTVGVAGAGRRTMQCTTSCATRS